MAVICALCCKKMVRIQERTNVNIRPVFNNSFAFSGWPAAFSLCNAAGKSKFGSGTGKRDAKGIYRKYKLIKAYIFFAKGMTQKMR